MNFFGLSFVSPAYLGLMLVAPVIILAYLNRSPRNEKIVSSILLLRLLPRTPSIKQKVKIPPLFWLELLTLMILGFLAAYPNYNSKGARIGIILDNSLSMRAKASASSRFELAKEEIKNWIELQSDRDRFTLYSTSPRFRRESGKLVGKGDIKQAIASTRVSSSPDYLEESLSELVSSAEFDKIFVVSDKVASFERSSGSFQVDSRVVGDLEPNTALSNLRFDKRSNTIVAAISQYGSKDTAVKIQAYLGGDRIAESSIILEPKRVLEARLNIPKTITGLIRVEVVLSEPDSIYIDNTGYILVGGIQTNNILLVTQEDKSENALGLDKLSTEVVSPKSYLALSESAKEEFRLTVFHGICPKDAPRTPSLFISPPIDCALFPGIREVTNPTISSWKTESPLTSYLDFSLLKLNRTVVFAPSNWAESVLNVEQGQILMAGERDGLRYACTGFELLPYEGSATPTTSILTLNLLSWLGAEGSLQDTIRTGAQIQPLQGVDGIARDWELVLPSGEIIRSDRWKDNDGLPRADAPGLYKLKNGHGEKDFVVNAFHPDESTTEERGMYEASYASPPVEVNAFNSDIWRSIIASLFIILAIELILRLYLAFKSSSKVKEWT